MTYIKIRGEGVEKVTLSLTPLGICNTSENRCCSFEIEVNVYNQNDAYESKYYHTCLRCTLVMKLTTQHIDCLHDEKGNLVLP